MARPRGHGGGKLRAAGLPRRVSARSRRHRDLCGASGAAPPRHGLGSRPRALAGPSGREGPELGSQGALGAPAGGRGRRRDPRTPRESPPTRLLAAPGQRAPHLGTASRAASGPSAARDPQSKLGGSLGPGPPGHPPRTLLQRLDGGFSLRAIHGGGREAKARPASLPPGRCPVVLGGPDPVLFF